jgi:hypothetical protein
MGPTYDIKLAPLSYSTPTSTASSYSHSVQPMQEFHVWCLSTWHPLEFPFLNKCRIHFRVSRFFRTSYPSPPSLSLALSLSLSQNLKNLTLHDTFSWYQRVTLYDFIQGFYLPFQPLAHPFSPPLFKNLILASPSPSFSSFFDGVSLHCWQWRSIDMPSIC